ncbi:MAG: WGR domain-containing protein [Sulfurimonas sp.]|jgi:predicted DNA-binding WGR domain protein
MKKRTEIMLVNSHTVLHRTVNGQARYYSLKIHPTLFQEFVLIREYGSNKNKKPTGVIQEYFTLFDEAVAKLMLLLNMKIKKGYRE